MYTLEVMSEVVTVEHIEHVVYCCMDVPRAQHNMKDYSQREILLLDTCLLYLYLIPD